MSLQRCFAFTKASASLVGRESYPSAEEQSVYSTNWAGNICFKYLLNSDHLFYFFLFFYFFKVGI